MKGLSVDYTQITKPNTKHADLQTIALATLVFFGAIVQMPAISEYQYVKAGMLLLAGIILIFTIRLKELARYRLINGLIFIYCVLTIVITVGRGSLPNAILYTISIAELYLLLEMASVRQQTDAYLRTFLIWGICLLVVVDIEAIAGNLSLGSYGYLVGTKFDVVYMHQLVLAFYLFKADEKLSWDVLVQFRCLILLVWTFVIAWYVDCATGLVGCVLYCFLWVIIRKMKPRKETLAKLSLPACLLCGFLLIFYSGIISVDFIQTFITDALHRDSSLTGRMDIYPVLVSLVSEEPIFGYGYGTTYKVMMLSVGYANTQNGLFEILIQGGIASAGLFFAIMYQSFKGNSGTSLPYAFVALAFAFILISCVEITYSVLFFAILAFVLTFGRYSNEKRRRRYRE